MIALHATPTPFVALLRNDSSLVPSRPALPSSGSPQRGAAAEVVYSGEEGRGGGGGALWLRNFRFSFVIFIPVFLITFSDLYALKICLICFFFNGTTDLSCFFLQSQPLLLLQRF